MLPFHFNKTDEFQDSGCAFDSCDGSSLLPSDNFSSFLKNIPIVKTSANCSDAIESKKALLVTPKKIISCSKSEVGMTQSPLTPTANLKVLLHAASPEIRDYERRKLIFQNKMSTSTDDYQYSEQSLINVQVS